ncbi:MAG: sphingosine kinase [Actinobacteria bacterium]|nr:MAG: sphingosine kinase [Actinomycetota bacterium]
MPTGPVAVLVNPTAGRGRHRGLLPAVLQALAASGRAVEVVAADTGTAAPAACRAALDAGAGALVAVGGDGTVHLALQAVAGTPVPFGIVPAGTGNDIATNLGLPTGALAAAEAVAEALRTGRTRAVDLGRVALSGGTQRWFAGVLGAGFDAIVNERANGMRYPRGPRRYDVAIFNELLRLRPRTYQLGLDGAGTSVDAVLVAIANTACYGGGFRIAPDADPTDGLLDIVVGGRFTRAGLVRILPRVRRGTHIGHVLVTAHRARTVTVDAPGITAYADGERIGPLPLTATCVPGALTLLC